MATNLDPNTVWAKSEPPESLKDHTQEVVKVWKQLREQYKPILGESEEFWFDSLLSVAMHDAGKITDDFQGAIGRKGVNPNIRHEFISGMMLFICRYDHYVSNPLSLYAVFSHHKSLTGELFSTINSKTDTPSTIKITFPQTRAEELLNNIQIILSKEIRGTSTLILKNIVSLTKSYSLYEQLYFKVYKNAFFDKTFTSNLNAQDRRRYIFFKALLNIADWTASGHQRLPKPLEYTEGSLKDPIISKLKNEGKLTENFTFRAFQQESGDDKHSSQNILAIAPTGSGKTEASLLWAAHKQAFAKIVYLLPTRITSNAMYRRLCGYFGDENVALVHSSAVLVQKDLRDGDYDQKQYLRDKTFFKPVTIATIDQMLTQGFNLGFWEIKTFHLLHAKVIIDEVHLYQPYTLGLIIASIKYLRTQFNTQFFVMSATMPQKLRTLLLNTLGEDCITIADTELLEKTRSTFEIRQTGVDGVISEITQAINAKKKVLLVVNTVAEAMRLYDAFAQCKPICYHSRFIQLHRNQKEQDILAQEAKPHEGMQTGCLLIATQVVEVSLDIDYDILFTENAPIDAIIQRAGRINRARKKDVATSKVIIFQHTAVSQENVYTLPNVLENTFEILQRHSGQALSEQVLTTMVDEVYHHIDIEENAVFQDALKKYDQIQRDSKINYIGDLTNKEESYTREGLDTVSVIPKQFQGQLKNSSDEEKAKYSVSIRRHNYRNFKSQKKITEDDGYFYIDAPYTFEKGLDLSYEKTPKSMENPHITV